MEDQLYYLVQQLLIKNNIRVNKDELKLQIASHPSYPSLHAVVGVLDHFNVPNIALRVVANHETLESCPQSFLAMVNEEAIEKLVLVEKRRSMIRVTHQDKRQTILSGVDFMAQWTGIVIAIEETKGVKESNHFILPPAALTFLTIVGIVALFAPVVLFSPWIVKIQVFLSAIGFGISVLLVREDFGMQLKFTQRFCNLNERTSCQTVLESKGANLFNEVKLSDLCILVFGGILINHLFFYYQGISLLPYLFVLSVGSIPFVIYSLYYQYIKLKVWCPLCLGIVGVLSFEFMSLWFFANQGVSFFNIRSLALFLAVFIISTAFWAFLKPMLQKERDLEALQVEHYKFKRSFSIFNALLKEETNKRVSQVSIPNEIILGNPNADLHLVLVTSPLCYYCKEAHRDVKYLLEKSKNIKISLRFISETKDTSNLLFKMVSELLYNYHNKEESVFHNFLNQLYRKELNVASWANPKNNHEAPLYNKVMDEQRQWTQDNDISFTPALFVEGYLFPKEYKRKELLYFIEDLLEEKEKKKPARRSISYNQNTLAHT